ncbi:phage holin family protein [Catellatospora tritici]|uniref:phage holin family protein n=1 Tax=Catellatospora tritici TaxID=2851566 RepID=UPI001C2D297F|nr:phage holin family protein [Catellatospora tritici]MBV1852112.1 phage holin family protein [Catellatospora tritici]
MGFLIRWVINAVALWITTLVVKGIDVYGSTAVRNALTLIIVALIFGLVNAVLKPVIHVLGCVFYVLTLGLFALLVNALLFLLVGWLSNLLKLPFHVDGFWPAFWGAIVMAVVSWALSLLVPDSAEQPA